MSFLVSPRRPKLQRLLQEGDIHRFGGHDSLKCEFQRRTDPRTTCHGVAPVALSRSQVETRPHAPLPGSRGCDCPQSGHTTTSPARVSPVRVKQSGHLGFAKTRNGFTRLHSLACSGNMRRGSIRKRGASALFRIFFVAVVLLSGCTAGTGIEALSSGSGESTDSASGYPAWTPPAGGWVEVIEDRLAERSPSNPECQVYDNCYLLEVLAADELPCTALYQVEYYGSDDVLIGAYLLPKQLDPGESAILEIRPLPAGGAYPYIYPMGCSENQ